MTHPWKWAVFVALGLAACERSNVTRAEIDASALRTTITQASAASWRPGAGAPRPRAAAADTVHVGIQGAGFDALDVHVDPNSLQATVDVPSGPDRVFEVTARSGDDASLVTYFGRVRRDMPSGATVSVVLPAFPAGLVRGTAATLAGAALPSHTMLHVQATAPRPDAPASFDVPVQNGNFAQALPAGAYQLSATVKMAGITYSTQQDFMARAGEATDLSVVLRDVRLPHLVFSKQPTSSLVAGTPVGAEVSLVDRSGALVTDQALIITFTATNPDTGEAVPLMGATPQSTSTQGTLAQGKLSTGDLRVNLAGGPYALSALASELQAANSNTFSVTPGALTQTGVVPLATVMAGVPFPARVGGVDALNNIVPTFVGTVQLSTSDPGATVPASVDVTASDAGGHLTSLTLVTAGDQILQTSTQAPSQRLSGRTVVTVAPNAPAALAFAAPADANMQACVPPNIPLQVRLFDAYGNFASNGTAAVTLGLQTNPGRAPLRGTLTVNAVAGVASFSDVTLSSPGNGYILRASAAGLSSSSSSAPLNARAPTPTLRLLGSTNLVATGPVPVAYVAQQACGEATDVVLSYEGTNGEAPASPLGNGVTGVLEQAAAPRTLTWDMPRDLGANANMATTLHLRPRSQGVVGAPVNVQVLAQSAVNPQSLGTASGAVANVSGAALVAVAVGDMDGNGLPDMVGVTGNGASLEVFTQTSPGVYTALAAVPLSGPATRVRLGDLDRDGDLDAVVALPQENNAQILINRGDGTLQAGTKAPFTRGVYDLALADLNKDGQLDLAVTSDANGFSYSTNANFATPLTLSTLATCTRGLALADVTRDGSVDAVVADCNRRVLVGSNTGTSFSFTPYATDANVDAVALGDFNKDGVADVVAVHGSAAHLTVFLGSATPPAFLAGDYLNPGTVYTLPAPAQDVAVADLNGDGNLDLVALLQDGSLAALSGDGSGALHGPVSLAPRGVGTMAAADLNHDGAVDLALATANGVAAALNQQPPSRRIPAHVARGLLLAEAPLDLAVGNLNADGNPDLVVCMGTEVQTLLGRGDGLFTPGPTLLNMAQSATLVDLNRDHLADLVLAEAGASSVSTALSQGDGTFAAPVPVTLAASVQQVLAGDLDEDGNADVAALSANGATALFGDGSGELDTPMPIDLAGISVGEGRLVDVTGDGHLDLAVINAEDGNVVIAAGNGDGSFAPSYEVPGTVGASSLWAADLDGDGNADLVLLGGAYSFAVLMGQGGGTFALPVNLPIAAQQTGASLALGDFNADGKMDAFMGTWTGQLVAHAGDGSGGFSAYNAYTSLNPPRGLRSADLDGDGAADVVAFSSDSNALVAHVSNRSGFFAAQSVGLPGNTPHHPQLLDLNRDGKLDVLVPCTSSNLIAIALATGGGTLGTPTTAALNTPGLIVSADFNRDGIADVVTAASNGNTLQFAPGNGNGGFGSTNSTNVNHPLNALAVVDYNRDGAPDIIATSRAAAPLILMANQGGGSFAASAPSLPSPSGARELAAGDFNHDGRADVAVTQDTNSLWLGAGDGNGVFTLYATVPLPAPAQNIVVADLDGDGRDDLAVTLPNTHAVALLRNLGGGAFAQTALPLVTPSPTQLSVGDVDGDGAPDLVVSTSGTVAHVLVGDHAGGVKDNWQLVTHGDVTGTAVGDVNGDGRADIVATSNAGDVIEIILSGYP